MRIVGTAALACFLLAAQAKPVTAASNDMRDKLINNPATLSSWGAKVEKHRDSRVQGGIAMRVATTGAETHSYDAGVYTLIEKPVKAGDRLVLAFWARLDAGSRDATGVVLPHNAIQESAPPNRPVVEGAVTITEDWQMHQIAGTADRDYPAGALNAALQLAVGKQVIDIGPVYVLDLGSPSEAKH